MRIRSIKPEFWRSQDISTLPRDARLLFIGLWSYVDDNGVGVDRLSVIAADLFADDLAENPRDTLAYVSGGLQKLAEANLIARYKVGNKAFLYVNTWDSHQRIDKPNKARHPLPTSENAEPRETLATPSRDSSETPAPGAGEQGNRGTGEQASTEADTFDQWWATYPRKEAKGAARKAYQAALKKTTHDTLQAAVEARLPEWGRTDRKFIPLPSSWLNAERWGDELSTGTARAADDIDWDAWDRHNAAMKAKGLA